MTTDDSLEIIEIIDDDVNSFGDRHHGATTDDTAGPRWVGPVAAAALIGLISYGVATSTGSAPKAAPITVTSTSMATFTTSSPTTSDVVASPAIPYYAAQPPEGSSVRYAQRQPFPNDFGLIDYQLWATPDASATTGSWFSATTSPGAPPVNATNAYRLQAGDLSIAVSHAIDEHAVAQFTLPGHVGVTVTSFGWSDDNLVRLASSMQADQSGLRFTDKWFTSDHQLISLAQPWLVVRGLPVEQIVYSSRDLSDAVVVTIGQSPPGSTAPGTDDRQIALRFLLEDTIPFTVDVHTAIAGTVIGASNYSIATWLDGENIVTVSATMPVSQLITIARSVHQVPTSVWAGMQYQADQNNSGSTAPEATPVLPVASSTDPDGRTWTITVAGATRGDQRRLSWSWDGTQGIDTAALDTAQINTVVDDTRTLVLADLPRAVAATAELHVLRDGLDAVVIPFIDTDPNLDRTFAAFAFTEAGRFTAQVVASDGTVLANWPSV